jgi:hypothetical protein
MTILLYYHSIAKKNSTNIDTNCKQYNNQEYYREFTKDNL